MERSTGSSPSERSLAHYIGLFRRNWLLIALPTAVAMAAAYLLSSRSEEIYRSSATVRVIDPGSAIAGAGRSSTEIDQELATSVELLGSRPVREAVLDEVPPDAADAFRSFAAERVDETVLVEFRVEASDAEAAHDIAEAWGAAFVEQERSQGGGGLTERATELAQETEDLQRRINELDELIAELSPVLPTDAAPPRLSGALNERQSLLEEQAEYRRRSIEFEIEAELREGAVAIVVPASEPGSPVSPKPVRTTAAAAVLGLLLGSGLAVLRDELDDRLRGRRDLRQSLPGLPLLAAVPGRRRRPPVLRRPRLRLRSDSGAIEAFRALATNLELVRMGGPAPGSHANRGRGRVIVVTSPQEGAGKTTSVAHLSNALAAVGREVVLIDADLRKGNLHEPFGARPRPGITEIVVDGVEPGGALQVIWTERHPDIKLLAGGRQMHDPVHILSSDAFVDLVEQLAGLADYVLIDAPPVLPVTDTLMLSRLADGVILVLADGKTTRSDIQSTVEALDQIDATVLGTVLTGAKPSEASYGYRTGAEPLPNLPRSRPPGDLSRSDDPPPSANGLASIDGGGDRFPTSEDDARVW